MVETFSKEQDTIEQEDLGVVKPELDESSIKIENLEKLDRKELNVGQYIGKEVKVAKIEVHKGIHGFYIKVSTEIMPDSPELVELKASKIYGIELEEDNKVGWIEGAKLDLDLKKFGVTHPKDLVGVKVKVQTRTNREGIDFLTF